MFTISYANIVLIRILYSFLNIKVKEPPTVDMSAVSNDLANLAQSGNLQTLTQQAVAAGSVMNKAPSSNSTDGNSTDQSTKVG